MKDIWKKSKRAMIVAFIFVIIMGLASLFGPQISAVAKDRYSDLQLFAKVLNLVQQYYVEEVDTKKLIFGGIKGMLHELDPHTAFMPPEVFKEFESETSGEFGGLGIEITLLKGILTVISPIEDAPAYVAGIMAGDRIVSINGETTKGLNLVDAAQKMRGAKGTKIILGIYREGFSKPKDFTVVRGIVKVHSVKYTDLEGGYAYVRLTSFIENSAKEFKKAIDNHIKKNKIVRGLILDLRKNPGGLLDQAVAMSDFFLDKGIIVSTMDRNKKDKKVLMAKSEGTLPKFPLVVLVDEYSASASEILAGALQDHKRALIMGQRSFGKGSVQSVVKLGDGSGLKLTVARYYTPSGRSIQAEGIAPDVVVDALSSEVIEKALSNNQVRREIDMSGHLEAESNRSEGEADELDSGKTQNVSNKKKKEKDDYMQMWWNGGDEKAAELSPKGKLLKDDFQILQAYNYLRAWRVMTTFESKDTTSEAEASTKLDVKTEPVANEKPVVPKAK